MIVAQATGSPITMAPYLGYLHKKYGELYRLPQSKFIDSVER